MRRVHAFIGLDPTAAECPDCGKVVPWSGVIDEGWIWKDYGKPWQQRVWLGGRNSKGPKEWLDMREEYWIEDPIETRVVREGPHPGTTGDIEPDIMDSPEVDYAIRTGDTRPLLAAGGECAVCGAPLDGPQRICEECCHEGRGA